MDVDLQPKHFNRDSYVALDNITDKDLHATVAKNVDLKTI